MSRQADLDMRQRFNKPRFLRSVLQLPARISRKWNKIFPTPFGLGDWLIAGFIVFLGFIANVLAVIYLSPKAYAGEGDCTGKNNLAHMCMSCFFPMTIGDMTIISGKHPDPANPSNPICSCGGGIWRRWGIAMGYWEPAYLIDVTRHPYCMVNFGGQTIRHDDLKEGGIETYSAQNNRGFYYAHVTGLPSFFSMLFVGRMPLTDNNVYFLTEIYKPWRDEWLNSKIYPEILPIAATAPVASLANMAECVATAANQLPWDYVYWNAGCNGLMYPPEGEVGAQVDGAQASVLVAERLMLLLHRSGQMTDSDAGHLCYEYPHGYLPKSRYRYQLLYPFADSDCHPFGTPTDSFAARTETEGVTGDYGYLIWKKSNVCEF